MCFELGKNFFTPRGLVKIVPQFLIFNLTTAQKYVFVALPAKLKNIFHALAEIGDLLDEAIWPMH